MEVKQRGHRDCQLIMFSSNGIRGLVNLYIRIQVNRKAIAAEITVVPPSVILARWLVSVMAATSRGIATKKQKEDDTYPTTPGHPVKNICRFRSPEK
ncbi:hypothetical protein C5167_004630 [Papaver somniferum]|uniref:Uncharacterized protein n=1 Tax=Papaver somniferum TaxID=3469 RepID=A0A4Y7J927_PAPSO|nr:hypothetical protein C5167_004630 [Papaver somniferum]